MRNPENGVGTATPYLITNAFFVTKFDDILIKAERKKRLII
jgi:hypothetical protein